jgi:hypothetical protein
MRFHFMMLLIVLFVTLSMHQMANAATVPNGPATVTLEIPAATPSS